MQVQKVKTKNNSIDVKAVKDFYFAVGLILGVCVSVFVWIVWIFVSCLSESDATRQNTAEPINFYKVQDAKFYREENKYVIYHKMPLYYNSVTKVIYLYNSNDGSVIQLVNSDGTPMLYNKNQENKSE